MKKNNSYYSKEVLSHEYPDYYGVVTTNTYVFSEKELATPEVNPLHIEYRLNLLNRQPYLSVVLYAGHYDKEDGYSLYEEDGLFIKNLIANYPQLYTYNNNTQLELRLMSKNHLKDLKNVLNILFENNLLPNLAKDEIFSDLDNAPMMSVYSMKENMKGCLGFLSERLKDSYDNVVNVISSIKNVR